MTEPSGGHHGFDGETEQSRPWRTDRLPGGGARYGAAYGAMTNALSQFLDQLAEALPDEALIERLTGDLQTWTHQLKPLAVPERERVFGRLTDQPGRAQSMSPKILITDSDADSVTGTVRFGSYYLGGNMAAHGGTVPLMFDEVLGRLAQSAGRPASRTAYLHTDFRAITPIGPQLDLHAWVVSEEGRKRLLRATLKHRDLLCAEAEGLFVALRPGQP